MPPRTCRALLLGTVIVGGLCGLRPIRAEVGPVPQWIRLRDPAASRRLHDTGGHDARQPAAESRRPWLKKPWLQKQFTVGGPLDSATLEVMADGDGVVTWLDDGDPVATVSSVTNRWVRVDLSSAVVPGVHRLRVAGPGPVCVRLRLVGKDGRRTSIVSDPTWLEVDPGPPSAPEGASRSGPVISLGLVGIPPWGNPRGEEVDYHQWKRALTTGTAEDAATVQVAPGFAVDLVRSSQPGESSWISLAFDAEGRVVIGREGRDKKHGLLRLTLPQDSGGEVHAESLDDTLLEPRGLAFHGSDLFVNANNAHSLLRLRDTDGDGRFRDRAVLKQTPGGVGHGRNNLAFGPDGRLYSIHGNDVRLPEDFDAARDMRVPHMALDRLRPCGWDGFLFDRNATLPAGHLVRTDVTGSRWEVVAAGFRNPYGIAFNEDGEAFTFDADNEGDLGAPWYRPTRINHVVEGGDYGWRQGTAMRPDWYPDSMPSTVVIGKSSPTGIAFGTRSSFPPRYRQALFILDWSYGRIYAVQLLPQGSSYVGTVEVFLEGRPLNVTGIAFGPDGAMYFTTGGRGTQSGLYRVRAVGPDAASVPPDVLPGFSPADCAAHRDRRRRLERLQPTATDLPFIAKGLDDEDEWIRHAAMTALLRFDPAVILQRGPAADNATSAAGLATSIAGEFLTRTVQSSRGHFAAILSLARILPREEQGSLLALLCDAWDENHARDPSSDARAVLGLPHADRTAALRAIQLCLLRLDDVPPSLRQRVLRIATEAFDGTAHEVDLLAFQILAHLDEPPVDEAVARTIMKRPQDQERAIAWLFELRNIRARRPDTRRIFLESLRHVGEHAVGGRELPVVLSSIAADFKASLTEPERAEFADLLAPPPHGPDPLVPQRPPVRDWTLDELLPSLAAFDVSRERAERGRTIFEQAMCGKCHRFADVGRPIGPDLDGIGGRLGRRDLLEAILTPSKVIDDKYKDTTLELKDGRVLSGRLIGGNTTHVLLSPHPAAPLATLSVMKSDIAAQRASPVSPMPVGLLTSFEIADIHALIAYLESNGAMPR